MREVDLVSYLPPFMADYKEEAATLKAEDPEFRLMWEAVDRLYKNEFILDADEYGISRFERLLKLHPCDTDTLEVRRLRVLAKWFQFLPYTMPWFRAWMNALCGMLGHKEFFVDYQLFIQLDRGVIPLGGEIMGIVLEILPPIIPANMYLKLSVKWESDTTLRLGGLAAMVVCLPVPELPDNLEFQDEIYAGGQLSSVVTLSIPEQPDEFDFQAGFMLGGQAGTTVKLPIPEQGDNLNFQGGLTLGGWAGSTVKLPVPERRDTLNLQGKTRAGGRVAGFLTRLPVVELADDLNAKSALGAGGKAALQVRLPTVQYYAAEPPGGG